MRFIPEPCLIEKLKGRKIFMKLSKFLALLVCVGVLLIAAQAMAVDYSSSGNVVSVIEFLYNILEAGKNDPEQVKSLLTAYNIRNLIEHDKANINAKASDGTTLLMLAAAAGTPEVVKMLLDAGADVNAKDVNGLTPLWAAVVFKSATPEVIKMLLDAGANVNDRIDTEHSDGMTPLIFAAIRSTPEVIKMLLDAGANVNDRENKYGLTPLMAAAAKNTNPEVIRILLRTGAGYREAAKEAAKTNENPEVLRVLETWDEKEVKGQKEAGQQKSLFTKLSEEYEDYQKRKELQEEAERRRKKQEEEAKKKKQEAEQKGKISFGQMIGIVITLYILSLFNFPFLPSWFCWMMMVLAVIAWLMG